MEDTYYDCPNGLWDPDMIAVTRWLLPVRFIPTGATGFEGETCYQVVTIKPI